MKGIAVGVDAGGTSTRAAVSRDGAFETVHESAGASASALGIEEAANRIATAIAAATRDETPDAIYVGAAGAGRAGVSEKIQALLAARFSGARIGVGDDASIVLRAVAPDGPGIVLVAGTGSIAYALNSAGERFRAGGYGYLLGDEGSGFAIGLAAARHLSRVLDGRAPADELSAQVQRLLGVDTQAGLFDRVYAGDAPVAAVAALAKDVIALASSGVRSANKIVQTAALELSDLVKTVAKKAALQHDAVPLVLAGGLLKENSVLTFLLETRLQSDLPGAEIVKRGVDAYRGALRAAEAMLA